MRKLALALITGGFLGMLAPTADACWDNTDMVVFKLKRLKLSSSQLKEVFALHKVHKDLVKRAHRDGLGCKVHEDHDAVFTKQAIGVLTDKQFKAYTGRARTEMEGLVYENQLLKKKIAEQKKKIAKLQAQLKKATANAAKKAAQKAAAKATK